MAADGPVSAVLGHLHAKWGITLCAIYVNNICIGQGEKVLVNIEDECGQ